MCADKSAAILHRPSIARLVLGANKIEQPISFFFSAVEMVKWEGINARKGHCCGMRALEVQDVEKE